jgi:hypothetical protein
MAGGEKGEHKAVSFGLVSDVQYADKEDKINSRGVTCAYRQSVRKLSAAVAALNDVNPPVDFVVHLGDLIGDSPLCRHSTVLANPTQTLPDPHPNPASLRCA